jgi:hypothetical protein
MTIEFKTNIKLPYANTEDAFELLETVVNNGQTRLSLEVLMDVLVAMINKIEELDETVGAIVEALSEEEPEVTTEKPVETKAAEVKPVEEKVQEEVKPETKSAQKTKAEEKKADAEEK